MMFSSNVLKKMVFPKNWQLNMIFFVISGNMVFLFPRKYDISSLDGKWKMILDQKYMEVWYFLYICINVTNMMLPFCQKNKDNLAPKKYN